MGGIPPLIQTLMDMDESERAAIDGADELLDAMIATRGEMGQQDSTLGQHGSRLDQIAAGLNAATGADDRFSGRAAGGR